MRSYDKKENLYKIEYSDGDVEEYDKEEFIYAYQLALEHGDHDEETVEQIRQNDQWSSEEESAYVLPNTAPIHPSLASLIKTNCLSIKKIAKPVKKVVKRKQSANSGNAKQKSAKKISSLPIYLPKITDDSVTIHTHNVNA